MAPATEGPLTVFLLRAPRTGSPEALRDAMATWPSPPEWATVPAEKRVRLGGVKLGVDYSATVSCYQADESGAACGLCDSCRLRREGFEAAGIADPTRYR